MKNGIKLIAIFVILFLPQASGLAEDMKEQERPSVFSATLTHDGPGMAGSIKIIVDTSSSRIRISGSYGYCRQVPYSTGGMGPVWFWTVIPEAEYAIYVEQQGADAIKFDFPQILGRFYSNIPSPADIGKFQPNQHEYGDFEGDVDFKTGICAFRASSVSGFKGHIEPVYNLTKKQAEELFYGKRYACTYYLGDNPENKQSFRILFERRRDKPLTARIMGQDVDEETSRNIARDINPVPGSIKEVDIDPSRNTIRFLKFDDKGNAVRFDGVLKNGYGTIEGDLVFKGQVVGKFRMSRYAVHGANSEYPVMRQ